MKRKLTISVLLVVSMLLIFTVPAFAHDGVGGDEYAAADIMFMVAMLFVLMTGIGVLLSWNNGEFKNPEGIKRMMLEMALDDEENDAIDQYALTEA